jgi:hypothetical protein
MSISQHIAGIKSRSAQNRNAMSEHASQQQQQHKQDQEANPAERPSQSYEDDLSQKAAAVVLQDHEASRSVQKPSFVSLEQVNLARDLDDRLQQINVLNRLEERWCELNKNLDDTLSHLQDCSYQVSTRMIHPNDA